MIYDYLKILHTYTLVIVEICAIVLAYLHSTRYCKPVIVSEDSVVTFITYWVVRLK